MEILLNNGADPNLPHGKKHLTPLHFICLNHHDQDVELLKKIFELGGRRVNVNAQDRQGRTPLFYAVVTLGPSLVDVLLDNGADLSRFTLPTFDDFADNSTPWISEINYSLILASDVMAIVDSLQKRGYKWYEREENNRTVGKLFVRYGLFQYLSDSDIRLSRGKCWFEKDAFVEKAKEIKFKEDLSLHEVIQWQPKVAKQKLYDASQQQIEIDRQNNPSS
ncbi:hypothetical protein TKK_0004282 [Trichogramma kaykai]